MGSGDWWALPLDLRAQFTILYSEPHRHYHTLEHIQHCLREIDCIPNYLLGTERQVLMAATWIHDAVYDPKARKGKNEQDSIDLMYNSKRLTSEIESYLPILDDIVASTISHKVVLEEEKSAKDIRLIQTFLDVDLSILGQAQEIYDTYSANIRQEYSFVPMADYASGRIALLTQFLQRDRIYFTDHFHARYEHRARTNLEREISSLAKFDF